MTKTGSSRFTHPAHRVALYSALVLIAIVFLAPLLWMITTAIKPETQTLDPNVGLLPLVEDVETGESLSPLHVEYWAGVARYAADSFAGAWNDPIAEFPLYLKNSLIVALLAVSGMVFSSAIVAYGFSRLRWRGRNAVFVLVLATMMIPFPVIMAPLYIIFRGLGWIGTLTPLWAPAWFGGAFSIFLLRQFFLSIPRSLDEAAMIDGCSHFGIFRRIILPLSKPALAVVVLFQFIVTWNDFVGPLIFLNHQEQFTLSLGLFMYQSQQGATPWNLLMAASILVVLPVLVLFVLTQRYFVEGIATRGLKQ